MKNYRIRPATIDDLPALAATNIACWRETYGGLLPTEFLRGLETDSHYGHEHWQGLLQRWQVMLVEPEAIAAAAPEIAGFVLYGESSGTLSGFDAQVEKLYLRKSAQGRGLGRRLMGEAAAGLLRQARRSLVVWVIDSNEPALQFYQRLNGVRVGEPQPFTVGRGITLHEVAFVWADLAKIAAVG